MKKRSIIIVIISLAILIIAYYLISPAFRIIEKNDISPISINDSNSQTNNLGSNVLIQGNFVASAHEVKGKSILINNSGDLILRFEDFETIDGPDLRIYLSSDLEAKDFIDLGEIKATKGNINYDLPDDIDISKYNKVLVWCRAFKVLFSYSDLQ